MKAILIGILSAVFFAVTFILNRTMELSGGSWLWSASLRYFFMVPFLFLIVAIRGNLKELMLEIRNNALKWLLWSMVGFGLFYGPLTFAAASGPGWIVAGTWQFTIIAGLLVVPFFYEVIETENGPRKMRRKMPFKGLLFSSFIFFGILFIQIQEAGQGVGIEVFFVGMLPVLVAAFAYPLGNRKMMEHCKGTIDTFQRVLGMTLASMPLWITLACIGGITVGSPSKGQIFQSFLVSVSSGVIATTLFFFATEIVKGDQQKLAAVEATQASEIIFVMVGEMLFLQLPIPGITSIIGIVMIIGGMLLHSLFSNRKITVKTRGIKTTSI